MLKFIFSNILYFSLTNAAIAKDISCDIFDLAKPVTLKYANLFTIKEDLKNKILFVGVKRKQLDADYVWWGLGHNVENLKKYLSNCSKFKLLPYPHRVVSTSTTHLSFIEDIEAQDKLKAFTQTNMITGKNWLKRVENKQLQNLPLALNIEHFIAGKFDLLLTYPESNFDDMINSLGGRLNSNSVNLIPVIEYLESTALARMEWIKFFGAIFDKRNEANAIFEKREKGYLAVVKKINEITNRQSPKVLMGEMLGNKWVYPSEKSDFVAMCVDLKIEVIRPEIRSAVRKTLGPDFFHLEEIISIKHKIDFWLLNSAYYNKSDLIQKHSIYAQFSDKKIISLKKEKKSNTNYHLYWESGVNRADQLILDLAAHFYPQAFAKHQSVWFNELL